MVLKTVTLSHTKDTKGTHRYDATLDPATGKPQDEPFTCLYIKKSAMAGVEPPQLIHVDVHWE